MPNLCANRLSIPPRPGVLMAHEQMIITSLRGPNGALDFESVLPIPAPLRGINRGGQFIDDVYVRLWREECVPGGGVKSISIADAELARYRSEYGADNPLDWCILRWGCKWNAECHDGEWQGNGICFDTAWNPPRGFVQALSRKFPDIQFELCFVEPGCAMNGRVIYYRGEEWQSEDYGMDSDAGIENAERVGITLSVMDDEPCVVGG
jgi:hypothetical protein